MRQRTAELAAVWIGCLIGLVALALTVLGAWLALGRPTNVADGYLVATVTFGLLVVVVAYALPRPKRAFEDGRHSF